jgi:hypothetical protein
MKLIERKELNNFWRYHKGRVIRYIFCEVPIAIGTSQKDAAAHEQSELAKQSLTQTLAIKQ